ncbi:MAG: hypothetical protein AAGB29_01500 [Planctomycetota bacterium]
MTLADAIGDAAMLPIRINAGVFEKIVSSSLIRRDRFIDHDC